MSVYTSGGGSGGLITYPYPSSHSRCPNCGYCSCCGKSDIPGARDPLPAIERPKPPALPKPEE